MKKIVALMFLAAIISAAPSFAQQVKLDVEKETIPTHQIGAPEVNPIFFTGRVYQGAEGYIYPYPLYDVITDKVVDKTYEIVKLKNDYISIGVLPEIGGRIFQAEDLTDNYHFFYTQTGIKPALIGMLGAWLSGGVEWDIPDHHRASSYMLVDWTTEDNPDGSKTVWVGESELRHRLKWSVGITIFPNSSRVQASVKVINPTPMIQSMLHWANVSVHCDENYQVIFPPDVQFGTDHSKVYFTRWPDGPAGRSTKTDVDLSWWKNFNMGSRSIFAWGSQMGFLGGYDHAKDAGTVHVANRFQVPGKKFFLWGNNPTGMLWNKILSDNDGHYLELMVGGYSDNQPDYSWLAPGEIREFKQTWFPIKGIKGIKNATEFAAVNLQKEENGKWLVGYNASIDLKGARVILAAGEKLLIDKKIDINPEKIFLEEAVVPAGVDETDLYTALCNAEGNLLVDYRPVKLEKEDLPSVIDGTKPVEEYKTVEELYLAGLRVDQFNNARLDYMDFYNEALRRDPGDARVNIEVGKHYIRQAEWAKAEEHLLRAKERLEHDYTRAYDTEADYYLGYVYRMTGRQVEAEENLWAATYTPAFKHPAYYQLAVASTNSGDLENALKLVDDALLTGAHDLQALTLKAYLLRKLGKKQEALDMISAVKGIDPLDYWSEFERSFIRNGNLSFLKGTRDRRSEGIIAVQELLEVASNYLTVGDKDAALAVIDEAIKVGTPFADYPLVHLYRAYLTGEASDVAKASSLSPDNNFPLRVEEVAMFETLEGKYPDNSKIPYYFGNLLYYLGQKERGLAEWHKSVSLDPTFSLACRNVGFGEGQKGNFDKAIEYYDMAIKANPSDPMLFTESDKLCEKAEMDAKTRLKRLESHLPTVMKHDDAVMRLLQAYNETGNYDKAIKIMDTRHFHLWEGGGQIHNIYVASHILKGQSLLDKKKYDKALKEFELATLYPANLEVPAPAGKTVTLESMLQEMEDELNDNYAKFGEDDKAATEKRIEGYRKLLEIVKNL
jgi:tetratricopeptide (TPR) repeat protein